MNTKPQDYNVVYQAFRLIDGANVHVVRTAIAKFVNAEYLLDILGEEEYYDKVIEYERELVKLTTLINIQKYGVKKKTTKKRLYRKNKT